jgi:DNA repair exonuclease SbcCD ATPase subunit
MTDIVERLREGISHEPDDVPRAERLMDDAADEIERLKAIAQAHNDSLVDRIAENERLREAYRERRDAHDDLLPKIAALRAENERLREALAGLLEISQHAIVGGDWKVDGACDPLGVMKRARAAIQPKGEK